MLTVWKVDFEYQVKIDPIWRPKSILYAGSDNGGVAANAVQDKMIDSEAEVNSPSFVSGPIITQVTGWRLTGLQRIGPLDIIDAPDAAADVQDANDQPLEPVTSYACPREP